MNSFTVERSCAQCGIAILVRIERAITESPRFCSFTCSGLYHRKPFIVKNGYRLILKPEHPAADSYGYIREHRFIAERMLGRPLEKGEIVHHINHDKQDNRPKNLQVFPSNSEHMLQDHRRKGKLTTDAVREIRRLRDSGTSVKKLMKMFNVRRKTIYNANLGKTYRHVK